MPLLSGCASIGRCRSHSCRGRGPVVPAEVRDTLAYAWAKQTSRPPRPSLLSLVLSDSAEPGSPDARLAPKPAVRDPAQMPEESRPHLVERWVQAIETGGRDGFDAVASFYALDAVWEVRCQMVGSRGRSQPDRLSRPGRPEGLAQRHSSTPRRVVGEAAATTWAVWGLCYVGIVDLLGKWIASKRRDVRCRGRYARCPVDTVRPRSARLALNCVRSVRTR